MTLAKTETAIRRVARLLRKHGITYRDIEIGRDVRRDKTYAIVTLENRQKVTGDIELLNVAYNEFGASGVNIEDTFIAKCLMLQS